MPQQRLVYMRSRQDMTWLMLDLKRVDFSPRKKALPAGAASGSPFAPFPSKIVQPLAISTQ